jgi:hypothetical protein
MLEVLDDRAKRKSGKEAERPHQQNHAEDQRAEGWRIARQGSLRGRHAGLGCERPAKLSASAANPYRPASMAIVVVTL